MNHVLERQHEFSNDARKYLANNPTASNLPYHLQSALGQIERYQSPVNLSAAVKGQFNQAFIEQEINNSFEGRTGRMEIRQRLAAYMERVYEHTGLKEYKERSIDLFKARKTGVIGLVADGRHVVAWDEKVNCVRLCPDDAREDAKRLNRKYGLQIYKLLSSNRGWRLFYCVYTDKNSAPGELLNGKRSIYKDFAGLHRTKWGKAHIMGTFATQEDPLSASDDWNIHINALHLVSGDFDFKTLRQMWGRNVEIRQVQGSIEEIAKSLMEIIKYAAKHVGEKSEDGKHTTAPGMTDWSYERFHEWYYAGKRFRRSRSYGQLFRVKNQGQDFDMDSIQWVGSARWMDNGYLVNLKHGIGVDLIQADKSALPDSPLPFKSRNSGASPPNREYQTN